MKKNSHKILLIALLLISTSLYSKITKYDLELQDNASLKIESNTSSNFVNIKAPLGLTNDINLTLPNTNGNNGDVLASDGNGTLFWTNAGASNEQLDNKINIEDLSVEARVVSKNHNNEIIESNASTSDASDKTGTKKTNTYSVSMSQPNGISCASGTYEQAVQIANDNDARLPSLLEVENSDLASTGCSYDDTAIWTQTDGSASDEKMVANGAGGTDLTSSKLKSETHNISFIYDIVSLSALTIESKTPRQRLQDIEKDKVDFETASTIAKSFSDGVFQKLLADDGQIAKNLLFVPAFSDETVDVQGVSLGDGIVFVYDTVNDYLNNTPLYIEAMQKGEPIVFTSLKKGAIILANEGFYGFAQISTLATMPLLSLGFSFTDTFIYAFRASTFGNGKIFLSNGGTRSEITITTGAGAVVQNQENIELNPYESKIFDTNGDGEYRIRATNPVIGAIIANASASHNYDARIIMPLTNDGITHVRYNRVSALYNNTTINVYSKNGIDANATISPNSPIQLDTSLLSIANNTMYHPDAAIRIKSTGLISSLSGADNNGGDATAMIAIKFLSQVVAQPFFIKDSGTASKSSLTIFSPYKGTAKVYSWNTSTNQSELAYTLSFDRGVSVINPSDQLRPAGTQLNPDNMTGHLNPGYIEADVPIYVVVQSSDTNDITIRSQNGSTSTTIGSIEDETTVFGLNPQSKRIEIREDANGLLRKRTIDENGSVSWDLL